MIPLPSLFVKGDFGKVMRGLQTIQRHWSELAEMFKDEDGPDKPHLHYAQIYQIAIDRLREEAAGSESKEDLLVSLLFDIESRIISLEENRQTFETSGEKHDEKIGLIMLQNNISEHKNLTHF